jgi:hypothetical protein
LLCYISFYYYFGGIVLATQNRIRARGGRTGKSSKKSEEEQQEIRGRTTRIEIEEASRASAEELD